MDKIKIYKSVNKHTRKSLEERGYGTSTIEINLYIFIYKTYALLLSGGITNDTDVIDLLKNKYFKISSSNLEYLTASEGQIKGDFEKQFLIEFDTSKGWYLEIIECNEQRIHGIKTIGLVGKNLGDDSFKATMYHCFGEVLFQEDTFQLIHSDMTPIKITS